MTLGEELHMGPVHFLPQLIIKQLEVTPAWREGFRGPLLETGQPKLEPHTLSWAPYHRLGLASMPGALAPGSDSSEHPVELRMIE